MSESAERFGRNAANYVTSEIHCQSPSLELAAHYIEAFQPRIAGDIACGGGHFAARLLQHGVPDVIAVDPSRAMLDAACGQLADYGDRLIGRVGPAEALPLADGAVDMAVSRLAAHHFADIRAAVNEMARVTARGGTIILIDLQGFDDPAVDALNHRLECLHDPTHGRSYRHRDWLAFLEGAGCRVTDSHTDLREREGGVPVWRWCQITETPPEDEAAIREHLRCQPPSMLDALGVAQDEQDFRMPIRTALYVAKRP